MITEIGRMQDAASEPFAVPLGQGDGTGAHGKARRTRLGPARRHAMLEPADADLGLGAIDTHHLARNDIRLAHEIGDEGGGRLLVKLARRT
jgi:hypothetical protein